MHAGIIEGKGGTECLDPFLHEILHSKKDFKVWVAGQKGLQKVCFSLEHTETWGRCVGLRILVRKADVVEVYDYTRG